MKSYIFYTHKDDFHYFRIEVNRVGRDIPLHGKLTPELVSEAVDKMSKFLEVQV